MEAQQIFYILGSIVLVIWLLVLVGAVLLLFFIKKKVSDVHRNIERTVNQFTDLSAKPAGTAISMGAAVAKSVVDRMKKKKHK